MGSSVMGSDTVFDDQAQATCMVGSKGRPDFNTPKTIWMSLRIAAPTIAILGLPEVMGSGLYICIKAAPTSLSQ